MSNQESEEAKAKGNEAFVKKDYKVEERFPNSVFQTALGHYTVAITKAPENHVLYSNRAACLVGLGQFEEALRDASTCVQLAPAWAKVTLLTLSQLKLFCRVT